MATVVSLDTASGLNLLQPSFLAGIEDMRRKAVFWYRSLPELGEGTFASSGMKFSVYTKRSAGYRPVGPVGAHYPPSGDIANVVGEVFPVRHAGTIKVEKYAQIKTQGDAKAFRDAAEHAYSTFLDYQMETMERESVGNGSGVLNRMGGIGSVTATATGFTFDVSIFDARNFIPGAHINFLTLTGTAHSALNCLTWRDAIYRASPTQGHYTIKGVTNNTATMISTVEIEEPLPVTNPPASSTTYSNCTPGGSSYTNLDFAVIADAVEENTSAGGTNLGLEMMGLDGIAMGLVSSSTITSTTYGYETGAQWLQTKKEGTSLADGLFQGISPTTTPDFRALVVDSTPYNSELSSAMLQGAMTLYNRVSTGGTKGWKAILAAPEQLLAYARPLENRQRYSVTGNTPSPLPDGRYSLHQQDGQGEALMHAGVPMIGNDFLRIDRAYVVCDESAYKKTLEPWAFGPAHPSYDNAIATEMNGSSAENILTRNRNKSMVIANLAIPTSY